MPTLQRFARGAPAIQYPRSAGVTVTQALARRLGTNEPRAHALLYRSPRLCDLTAEAIGAFADSRDYRALSRFLAPIDSALELANRPPVLDAALVVESQRQDLLEDTRETAHLTTPSRETARAWVRSIDAERAALLTLRQALVAKWEV